MNQGLRENGRKYVTRYRLL